MKTRVYLRVARTGKYGTKVTAHTKPNYSAINNGGKWSTKYYPTVCFAVDLDIPDSKFDASMNALQLAVGDALPVTEITISERIKGE